MVLLSITELARNTKTAIDLAERGEAVFIDRRGVFFEIKLADREAIGIETLEEASARILSGQKGSRT